MKEKEMMDLTFKPKINKVALDNENTNPNIVEKVEEI